MSLQPLDGFVGATYTGQSPFIDNERCLNLYPESTQAPGVKAVSAYAYYPTPGLALFSTAGTGPITASFGQDGRFFVVSGTEFYEVNASGTATKYGNVAANTFPAAICSNGTAGHQLLVISGGLGYIFDLNANTFAIIADGDFPTNVVSAVFSDGYFLVLSYNATKVYYSALFDGTSWTATDVFQKSQTSDSFRTMVLSHKELWLFGSTSTEVWQNTGDALVTFAPVQGVLIEHGISPIQSAARVNNTICWFGEDADGHGMTWYADGYTPMRFSTHAVEQKWANYGRIDDAIAWTYQDRGHSFFVLTFISAQATWVYDFATQMWHERMFLSGISEQAHLARNHAFIFEKHLMGSRLDGSIYEMSAAYFTDAGSPIRRVRRSPHMTGNRSRVTMWQFVLELAAGVAATTGQGSDPQVMLRTSVDGGRQWSNEKFASTGKLGDYRHVVSWNRLGMGRDWVFEVATSEPIDLAWTNAYFDARVSAN